MVAVDDAGLVEPVGLSTGTSVYVPRIRDVIGATVTSERKGSTAGRVRTRTGRTLSIWARKIGRSIKVHAPTGRPDGQGVQILVGAFPCIDGGIVLGHLTSPLSGDQTTHGVSPAGGHATGDHLVQ